MSGDWQLLRALVVKVGDPPLNFEWGGSLGSVRVETVMSLTRDELPIGTLVFAQLPLDRPPLAGDGGFQMPEAARAEAEDALETLARLVALEHGGHFTLASPSPCLGFTCGDEAALDRLHGAVVGRPVMGSVSGAAAAGLLDDPALLDVLSGRMDGLVLMTEALNAQSPSGQFILFWRLFERAFNRSHKDTGPLLLDFLADGPHAFVESEISDWVERRNPAIHANRRTSAPVLDRHVRPFVGRMREAAFDVLLNKADWHTASADRRADHPWRPASGSSGPDSGIFITPGKEARLRGQALDVFGSFPMLLAGSPKPLIPPGLWVTPDDKKLVLRRLLQDEVGLAAHPSG